LLRKALLLGLLLALGCGNETPSRREGKARLLSHVRVLSSEIGPRAIGTPGDRRAQDYIRRRLEEAGLQTRIDRVDRVRLSDTTDLVLDSANVVGVLPGTRTGALLVGAHHDSRNANCPGSADDASGVAVLLDAARILAKRPHHHTLVFVSFAGEEAEGLPGSREFLRNWKGDPIRLALTLDFVGSGRVFVAPFPVPPQLWANRLLAHSAERLRVRRVSFDPWLVTVPRLLSVPFGADHVSFLAAGIPALNLSCEFPAWLYHTSEDRVDRVEADTLLAARDLVVGMVSDADARDRVEVDDDPDYLPLDLFGHPFFLSALFLHLASLAVALFGLASLWRWRGGFASLTCWAEGLRAILVSLPLAALVVTGPFLAESVLARVSGFRHPGSAHIGWHLAGALLAAAFTLWVSLSLSRFIRPTTKPGAYLTPALLLEGLLAGACLTLGRLELAFPLLVGVCGMLLAAWSRPAIRRGAFGILGLAALGPFLSPTTYRMFQELSGAVLPPFFLEIALGILFFPWFLFLQHLFCLPEVLLARPGGPLLRAPLGAVLGTLALAAEIFNAGRPSYDRRHQVLVEVNQAIDPIHRRAEAFFTSPETLQGIRLIGGGGKELPDSTEARMRLPFPKTELPSLDLQTDPRTEEGVLLILVCRVPGGLAVPPRSLSLRVAGPGQLRVERDGVWEEVKEYHRLVYPSPSGTELKEEIRLRPEMSGGVVTAEALVSFDGDLLALHPAGANRVFRTSTSIRIRKGFPYGSLAAKEARLIY